MPMKMIEKLIRPLYGYPCWGLSYSRQTNLSMNFGDPSLRIREPLLTDSQSPIAQKLASRRLVTVRGEWKLWIYCCYWKLTSTSGTRTTGASSIRKIEQATSELSGQKLASISIDDGTGFTRFEFDLGCELECRRFDRENEDELWSLYRPNGYVLSVHGNGTYRHQRGTDSEQNPMPL